jgi:serine/threonine-protein kinase
MPEPLASFELHGASPLPIGQRVRGKWRVERLIGCGGMSIVYQASHRNGHPVALKVLRPELSFSASVRSRFLREGYIANQVAHPGAVRVLDDDEENGLIFLVMELLVGETLAARCKRHDRRISVGEALAVADQVLDVLAHAHAKGIAHRDLKPENIFICESGRVKIVDFGIASSRELASASQLTHTGIGLGTPGFMAREQARGLWDEVDGRTDLWSLGATMFTVLSGRHVFEGRSPSEMLIAAATQEPPSIGSVVPELPKLAAEVIDRALRVEKTERWADAFAMREALQRAMTDVALEGVESAVVAPTPVVSRGDTFVSREAEANDGYLANVVDKRTDRRRNVAWLPPMAVVAMASVIAFVSRSPIARNANTPASSAAPVVSEVSPQVMEAAAVSSEQQPVAPLRAEPPVTHSVSVNTRPRSLPDRTRVAAPKIDQHSSTPEKAAAGARPQSSAPEASGAPRRESLGLERPLGKDPLDVYQGAPRSESSP